MPRGKETLTEKLAKISDEEIASLKGEEGLKTLQKYVSQMKMAYRRRVQSFKRKDLVSHAQISFESSVNQNSNKPVSDLSRNQLILEFYRYKNFFNSKTSTEKGIKAVNRAEDIRIFGADKRGRPKKTMTNAERQKYWTVYDEFFNQKSSIAHSLLSEQIQTTLGTILTRGEIDPEDILVTINRLADELIEEREKQYVEESPNVYGGGWNRR